MKVVHVPFSFFPDPAGGTEVYVASLARALEARGVDSVIAAPSELPHPKRYEHEGVPVYRFATGRSASVTDLYGEGDEAAARSIAAILRDTNADVLHLHAFTRAASLRTARLARRQGAAVVFTYHTPSASCVRGTLMRNGHEPCDGELIAQRCTACLLESRGAPLAIREALSRAPYALGTAVASSGASGAWATALRARELTTTRHRVFKQLLVEADAVVAVCEWVRALLLRAGAPPTRLVLSRQGTRQHPRPADSRDPSATSLRLAFVGRLHPMKGVHTPLRALAQNPHLRVTLDIFGVAQDADGFRYREQLASISARDPRVRFRETVLADQVVDTLASYDATIVPSEVLETGPLTVLESFAAGVPVIGSNLGGIAELVTHDRDGWLVPAGDNTAWATAFERLGNDRSLVERLRAGVGQPRSMDAVACDMESVYASIVDPGARRAAASAGVA